MKSYHYEAVTYDASAYCIKCLPPRVTLRSNEVEPIFASNEVDNFPVCDTCRTEHTYMCLTSEGIKNHRPDTCPEDTWDEKCPGRRGCPIYWYCDF